MRGPDGIDAVAPEMSAGVVQRDDDNVRAII